jgi:hypothetical protein
MPLFKAEQFSEYLSPRSKFKEAMGGSGNIEAYLGYILHEYAVHYL